MQNVRGAKLEFWAYVVLLVAFAMGCPNSSGTVDAAQDAVSPPDVVDDLAVVDRVVEDALPHDIASDRGDAGAGMDVMDALPMGCVPGMSVACACTDGRTGAQVCRADRTYGPCQCTGMMDAGGSPDVALPPLPPRLIAPQSVSRVTSRRPTLRWVLPEGVTRARVELCADRPCTRMLVQQEVTGSSWRPTAMLAPGVTYWRVRGLGADGGVAWMSATWEFVVGQHDAPVDTSFGTLKDFNGDGYDDIAIPSFYMTYLVNVYEGRLTIGSMAPTHQLASGRIQIIGLGTGDFNGDGLADLAVVMFERHTVQIYYGSRAGLPQEPSVVLAGNRILRFAESIAIGDVDGDGYSDLLAVSTSVWDAGTATKTIQFFAGAERGLPSAPTSTIESPSDYTPVEPDHDEFTIIGDVNVDGYPDLVTGDGRARDGSGRERGRAWLVAGHPSRPLRSWMALPAPTSRDHFGAAVQGVGDLNGDGAMDFAIRSAEEVSVYLGTAGGFRTSPYRTIQNPEGPCYLDNSGFGSALGAGGDYNGDGYADLAIGARCLPYLGSFQFGEGSAFIYSGQVGGVSAMPVIFRGETAGTSFGGALGGIGDFNGDGFGDLAIVQLEPPSRGDYVSPTVYVFLGSIRSVTRAVNWTLTGGGRFYPTVAFVLKNSHTVGG